MGPQACLKYSLDVDICRCCFSTFRCGRSERTSLQFWLVHSLNLKRHSEFHQSRMVEFLRSLFPVRHLDHVMRILVNDDDRDDDFDSTNSTNADR